MHKTRAMEPEHQEEKVKVVGNLMRLPVETPAQKALQESM